MREIVVLTPGVLACVQDLGRPGLAGLGVGESGAADRGALRLANRLVGNPADAAAVEITLGGLDVRVHGAGYLAVTGAPCPLTVETRDGARRAEPTHALLHLPDGARLRCAAPPAGLRSYLAVRGGIAVPPVLGARATDTLSGIGPRPLRAGQVLPVGPAPRTELVTDLAPVPRPASGDLRLRVIPGPRADWFAPDALPTLLSRAYRVTGDSDRVGMRLAGPSLRRARTDELPSEGMVRGALQVPPSGTPTLFLADHPVTGGYPVIAVLTEADTDRAAQARPGQHIHFR